MIHISLLSSLPSYDYLSRLADGAIGYLQCFPSWPTRQNGFSTLAVPLQIPATISDLQAAFALKHLGPLHYLLGVEVTQTSHGLFLTQTKYT